MAIPQKIRLQRMIALSTELSRRAAEEAIARGEVTVNGEVASELGTKVDPFNDRVCLNNKPIRISSQRRYIAFFKPRGELVTKSDPQGRKTIWEHFEELKGSLNSVGRLDFDSEGLLFLTDDGDFLNRLTHPRHEIWKTYHVRVKGEPPADALARLKDGVKLSDGKTLPSRVRRIDKGGPNALLEISIREGRNRQVRRMCDAIGSPVIRLRRVSIGPVKLGQLKPGAWRFLRGEEVQQLIRESSHSR
ncbi:MAG: pseudouridine synthase [bacterium]